MYQFVSAVFDRFAVVMRHNEYRTLVTPPASNMAELVWDDQLECMAQKWTDQCKEGYDESASSVPGVYEVYNT